MLQLRSLQSDFDQVAFKVSTEWTSITILKPCFDASKTSGMGHPLEYQPNLFAYVKK